jgi:hypothetical protein
MATSGTVGGEAPSTGAPVQSPSFTPSNEYHLIAEHERNLRLKIERFEADIAAAEEDYLRQYASGNIVQGWDADGVVKRRQSDKIFSSSSSTWHGDQER